MDTAPDGFTAFVVDHETTLLRTAFLLTGHHGPARDLLLVALARAARRWDRLQREGEPLAAVRRLLLDSHLSRRSRLWSGRQVLETLPDPAADRQDVEAVVDELWRTLDLLPPRVRAVLVLRFAADLPEAATARLLGCPADGVRAEAADGAGAVRDALAGVAPGRPAPAGADPDDDVRDALELLAVRAGPPGGTGTAAAALALARRRRRTGAGWAAAALAVAVAAAAVPASLPDAAPVPGRTVEDRPQQAAPLALTDLPARGSLAGDEAFVAGVAAIEWSAPVGVNGEELTPPASTRRVLFAGDLPGGRRWALVVGEDGGQGVSAWFGGPAGAAPAVLTPVAPPERFDRDEPLALLDGTGPSSLLVVVARPGDTARYSSGSIRFDDGSIDRLWTDLPGSDGVFAAEVDPPVYDGADVVDVAAPGRSTLLRGVPRTDGSPSRPALPVAWVQVSPTTDPALRDRLTECLLPEGFTVRTGSDGDVRYGYPDQPGRRSDVELARLQAGYDAVLTACLRRVTTGD